MPKYMLMDIIELTDTILIGVYFLFFIFLIPGVIIFSIIFTIGIVVKGIKNIML